MTEGQAPPRTYQMSIVMVEHKGPYDFAELAKRRLGPRLAFACMSLGRGKQQWCARGGMTLGR